MKYVYILQSELDSEHYYSGITDNVEARLVKHNSGAVKHMAKFRPSRVKTYIAFSDTAKAVEFEKYLKTGSGCTFVKKRL